MDLVMYLRYLPLAIYQVDGISQCSIKTGPYVVELLVLMELNGSALSDDLYYRNAHVLASIYLCQLMLEYIPLS